MFVAVVICCKKRKASRATQKTPDPATVDTELYPLRPVDYEDTVCDPDVDKHVEQILVHKCDEHIELVGTEGRDVYIEQVATHNSEGCLEPAETPGSDKFVYQVGAEGSGEPIQPMGTQGMDAQFVATQDSDGHFEAVGSPGSDGHPEQQFGDTQHIDSDSDCEVHGPAEENEPNYKARMHHVIPEQQVQPLMHLKLLGSSEPQAAEGSSEFSQSQPQLHQSPPGSFDYQATEEISEFPQVQPSLDPDSPGSFDPQAPALTTVPSLTSLASGIFSTCICNLYILLPSLPKFLFVWF